MPLVQNILQVNSQKKFVHDFVAAWTDERLDLA
jgi:hypothetical protein